MRIIRSFVVLTLSIVLLSSCHKTNAGYDYAVLSSSEASANSDVFLFNKGKYIGTEKIKVHGMPTYLTPLKIGDHYCVISNGDANHKVTKVALLNPETLAVRSFTYPGSLIQSVTTDNKVLFLTNTCDFKGRIVKMSQTGELLKDSRFKAHYFSRLYYYAGSLFAFGDINGENEYLFELNPKTLKIIRKTDITSCGYGHEGVCGFGENLYFSNTSVDYNGTKGSSTLGCYNIKTQAVNDIQLDAFSPYALETDWKKIYVTHSDVSRVPINKISIYNPKNRTKQLLELDGTPVQISCNEKTITVLTEENLELFDVKTLKCQKTLKLKKLDDGKYFTAFLENKKEK
jgi:hypothetical protein